MSTKRKNKRRINQKIFDWILIAAPIIYLIAELYNRVFPIQIGLALFFVVIILMAIGLLVNSRVAKTFLATFILVAAFGLYYIQSQINKAMNIETYESNTVSFVVLRESGYESLDDLHHLTTLGVSENIDQELFDSMRTEIEAEFHLNGNLLLKQSDLDVANALYDHSVEVMVLDEAYRSGLLDDEPEFNTKTKVIYSYKKLSEKDDIAKEVDVRKDMFTVYISGIDTEGPINTIARSDVNMLMTVNPQTNEILLTNTPRDTFTGLRCHNGTRDKLTHAGIYGVTCSVGTLEDLYNVEVNYYARVNMTGLIELIDVLGSIEVYSHYSFVGYEGSYFTEGMNTMNAEEALEFSRTRATVPGGDFTRGVHQQEVIKGIINKVIQPESMLNIGGIVNKVSSSVDTNFGGNNLSRLIEKQIADNKGWEFNTLSLEGTGGFDYTYTYPHQLLWVFYPDGDSIHTIHEAISGMSNK